MSQSVAIGPKTDPILVRFRSALEGILATASSVLSRSDPARGDAQDDSDYDIAIFLTDFADRRQ